MKFFWGISPPVLQPLSILTYWCADIIMAQPIRGRAGERVTNERAGKEWRGIHQSIRQPLHRTVCQMNGASYLGIICMNTPLSPVSVIGVTSSSILHRYIQIRKIRVGILNIHWRMHVCKKTCWLETVWQQSSYFDPRRDRSKCENCKGWQHPSTFLFRALRVLLSCGPIIIQWLNHLVRVYGKFPAAFPVISRLLCLYRNNPTPRQTFSPLSPEFKLFTKTLED